jgi:bacteriocin-like protein
MSTDNIDPSDKDATISSTDDLVKTIKSGDVEMTEEELNRVSGGTPPKSDRPTESLSINFVKVKYEY